MPAAVCWSCEKVKGKRSCPARGGALICSRCCGTKRRVEIHCPSDCPYLHGTHDSRWQSESQQKEDARILVPLVRLGERQATFAVFLHHLLSESSKRSKWREDGELIDVLTTVKKTLETRGKGVIYSHPSSAPHLQAAADFIVRLLSERDRIEGAPKASDEELLQVLTTVLALVEAHSKTSARSESYLEASERLFEKTFQNAPKLELPDDPEKPGQNQEGPLIVPP